MPDGGGRHRYGEQVARTPSGPAGTGPSGGTVARPGRIRTLGLIAVLAVPLGLGLLAAIVSAFTPVTGRPAASRSGVRGLVLFAVPTALAVGLPGSPADQRDPGPALQPGGVGVLREVGQSAGHPGRGRLLVGLLGEVAFYAGGVVIGVVGGLLVMVLVLSFL